jgi:putative peptidoglycan lipid II flippase
VSLFKAASTVSLLTLASRVTGLVRDLLMASMFGANALTDAFNVAFRIPNLFRRLFAEGAFSQAFVPVLAATKAKEWRAATHRADRRGGHRAGVGAAADLRAGGGGAPLLVWAAGQRLAPEPPRLLMPPC